MPTPSGKIYDRLLSLPLFQGLSQDDLSTIVETTRFDFRSYAPGETIVRTDAPCTHLCIIMNGAIEVVTRSDDHSYQLMERLATPLLMEPERLFGLHQFHTREVKSLEKCQVLAIEKDAVLRLAAEYLVFRINLLNGLAAVNQRQLRQAWHPAPKALTTRIVRFVEQRALRPAGYKELHIKMTHLADELNDSRLDVSRALHDLQSRGLVTLRRGTIVFPTFEDAIRNG